MKGLQAIGIGKAVRFVVYTLFQKLLHWTILPPVRNILLRLAGAKIGDNTVIFDIDLFNAYHYGLSRLTIGNNCFLGDGVMLDVRGGIQIGNHVTLSNRTNIVTHINVGYDDHPLQKHFPTSEKQIVIEDGVYIGTGATILPGVKLGHTCVIGAGAVVTKNVPSNTVSVGVPSSQIKKLK